MALTQQTFVTVEVRALVVDPTTEAPVVILQVANSTELLPIWIGGFEAQSIAMAIEGLDPPRPMTHDLLKTVVEGTGYAVAGIRIHSLEDGVFRASATLRSLDPARENLDIDARPSDAIALALRANAPIEVSQAVMDLAQIEKQSVDDALRTILEQLDPEDLGQYEM